MHTPTSLHDLIVDVHHRSPLWTHPDFPFTSHWSEGHSQVVVVAGDNASGKSLFVQVMASRAKQHGMSPLSMSIRERCGAGLNEMASFRRIMIFGDEERQSTGTTSFKSLRGAFRSAAAWATEDNQRPIILLDEPEIGLSQGYEAAMGEWIAQQVQGLPDAVVGVVIVTHSKTLVRHLMDELNVPPTWVHFGHEMDIQGWLRHNESREVADLLALEEHARKCRRIVENISVQLRDEARLQKVEAAKPDKTAGVVVSEVSRNSAEPGKRVAGEAAKANI